MKDLSSLALDELIGNLKVHEVVMEKDFEIYKGKKERIKSIALKAKKESSDDETLTSRSDDEEYAMAIRNFKKCGYPNHLIGDCPKPSHNKDQKAFIGGFWRDSDNDAEDKTNDKTCLMAQSSNKVTLNSSCYSDNASSLDNDNMQIEYDSLCEISLKIITKNKILKTKRDLLEKEILELNQKIKKLKRSKEIKIACKSCDELKLENAKLKETQVRIVKFNKSANSLRKMLNNQKSPRCKVGLGFDSDKASTSGTKTMSFVGSSAEKGTDESTIKGNGSTLPGSVSRKDREKGTEHVFSPPMACRSDFVITRKKLIHNSIDESKKQSLKPSLKSDIEEEKDFSSNEVKLLKELLKEKTEQQLKSEQIRLEEQKDEEIRELKAQLQKEKEKQTQVQEEFLPLRSSQTARPCIKTEVHYSGNATTSPKVRKITNQLYNVKATHRLKQGSFLIEGNKFKIPLIYAFDMKDNNGIEMLIGANFLRSMKGGIRIEGDEITIYKKITRIKTSNQTKIADIAELVVSEEEFLEINESIYFNQEGSKAFLEQFKPVIDRLKHQGYIGEKLLKHWKKNGKLCKLDIINPDITIEDRPLKHVTPAMEDSFRKHVDSLLKIDVIRPSKSRHRTMAMIVNSGTTIDPITGRGVKGKERMVLNYKSLNDNTYKDQYSLPGINTIIKRIGGAKIFLKFDLKSGYHQVAMDEESISWTAL
ncbi:hypothetical protein Tco_0053420 [Tanacetum coccineum]